MAEIPDSPTQIQQLQDDDYGTQTHQQTGLFEIPDSPTQIEQEVDDNETQTHQQTDMFEDIMLWRRKQLNIFLLFAATTLWAVMEIYQYSFITILSYVTMGIALLLFLWGNVHRVLKREVPDLSRMEINDTSVGEVVDNFRQLMEKGIQLMFHVSVEREWYMFVGAVAFLYFLSIVASCTDFLTLSYIGLVGAMTVPVIYVKNQHRLKQLGERMKMESHRLYRVIEERSRKIQEKMAGKQKEIKEKKTE